MTYKAEYVVVVIQDGKIVPEKDGCVVLPYGSEYQIRLKNKSRQRSVADVYLDGSIACKGIMVDEDGTVDIERYIRNIPGDEFSGPKFKLARLDNPGVKDANDSQNGLLEIRFYKELPKLPKPEVVIIKDYFPYVPVVPAWPPQYPWDRNIVWCGSTDSLNGIPEGISCSYNNKSLPKSVKIGEVVNKISTCDNGPWNTKHENEKKVLRSMSLGSPAATVQGSLSKQKVENVFMEVDTTKFETLTLKLLGVTKVIRHDKCPKCNHKRKTSERFCPKCGEILVVEG